MPLDGVYALCAVLLGSWTQENTFHIPSGEDPGEHFSHFNNIIIFVLSNNFLCGGWISDLYFKCIGFYGCWHIGSGLGGRSPRVQGTYNMPFLLLFEEKWSKVIVCLNMDKSRRN